MNDPTPSQARAAALRQSAAHLRRMHLYYAAAEVERLAEMTEEVANA